MCRQRKLLKNKLLTNIRCLYFLDEAQALFFKISQTANPGSGVLISELLSGLKNTSQVPYLKEIQERQEKFRTLGHQDVRITAFPPLLSISIR